MKTRHVWATISILLCLATDGVAQQKSVDLLSQIDTNAHVLTGDWTSTDAGLAASAESSRNLCVVPYELTSAYELSYEFTRESGKDSVGVILPLGKKQVFLELSGWDGEAHGLSRINRSSVRNESNPTSVRPGTLKNKKRHQVVVSVAPAGDDLSITVQLDGKGLIDWSGSLDDVEPNIANQIASNVRPALVANKSVTVFHKLSVKHAAGGGKSVDIDLSDFRKTTPAPSPSTGPPPASRVKLIRNGNVDLTRVAWSEKKGTIDIVKFNGKEVVRTKGADDTVAFLPNVELGDGTIEVEIASDIFSGIAIRGADTNNYDLIYFRPQNSRTAKHEKTVQYVCKGKEGADWRTLRAKFPGKYEAGADIKVNEWFRVRIILEGSAVRVHVNDSDTPVLVVSEVLGGRRDGKIGLWGWNSHFRNFSFQPASSGLADDKTGEDP